MSANVAAFDHWIRGESAQINTDLEISYFAQSDRDNIVGVGDSLKQAMQTAGRRHAVADDAGNQSMRETRALAMQLGASLGVTPRFATSHMTTHNRAVAGRPKSFTNLPDELLFNDYNTRGIFAYKRAADALLRVLGIGITNPVAFDLLRDARDALTAVADYNQQLFDELDVDRFFYSVRPYFRPHRVGLQIYRGANAGDFAGINVIDLPTGLCRANNPSYSQLLVEKFLYMMPEDQTILRDCITG